MSLRRKIYEVIEVADKDDRDSLIYDRFMLVCIAASIVPLCFKETNALFIWLDRATVTVFIVDYLLRWWTADLKYGKSGKWAFLRYPFSFFGIVDLLSILPSLTMLSSGFKLFRLFRLNKALKALKFLRYSHSFELILNVIKRERRALAAVCVLAGGYIALSALIMFQVEPDSFDTFFDAIYWAVVTLTTVGYGDIYPTSEIGRIVSMTSSFMGIAIVALPTGIITAGYMRELSRENGSKLNKEDRTMEIRTATMSDLDAVAAVEAECFPVAEAATKEEFAERIKYYGDHFWLMFEGDKLIAFLDGFVTDEPDLTDEMYAKASMHDENGAWQMLFGLNTLPEYRKNGYAGELLHRAVEDARKQGRKGAVLTCKQRLVDYYAKFGFVDEGVTDKSVHGGVVWHQMRITF